MFWILLISLSLAFLIVMWALEKCRRARDMEERYQQFCINDMRMAEMAYFAAPREAHNYFDLGNNYHKVLPSTIAAHPRSRRFTITSRV